MKIKSINDFTLAECQEYLDTNPNGEFAKNVSERMLELSQINEVYKEECLDVQKEFIKQFNRLFATKRYSEAFLLCVNSTANPLLSSCARDKGEFVMPFLQKKGVINVPDNISMDFIIDILINNGYGKLNLKKNGLLSIFPNVRIGLQDNIITVKLPILLIVLVVWIYPFCLLLPITLPLLICSLIKRRRIIRIICSSLLQLNR